MKYCTRCLYPENHPLNITFDERGVCSGCRVHEEKFNLDWAARKDKLRRILDHFRSSGRSYDCIVPVSGGRDSYFVVHVVKRVFGMNPLLVTYNKHYNTKTGIRNLAYLQAIFGCDLINCTVSPDRAKRITRETLRLRGSMYWHCLAGSTVFPARVAVNMKIPLIVWGVHQGCDQVGMFSHTDEVEMMRKYRKEHDLMGLEPEDLVAQSETVSMADVKQFLYPNDREIDSVGVRGIYLGNYIPWDTKSQHEEMIRLYGYETKIQQRTFDRYNDVDCEHYSGVHDYLKYIKWGYGKATDHASREIRFGRLTREQGIDLVKKYQNISPSDLPVFLDWLGMAEGEFWPLVNRFRNSRIWATDPAVPEQWQLKDSVVHHESDEGIDAVRLAATDGCEFVDAPARDDDVAEPGPILIGRACVDTGHLPDVVSRFSV